MVRTKNAEASSSRSQQFHLGTRQKFWVTSQTLLDRYESQFIDRIISPPRFISIEYLEEAGYNWARNIVRNCGLQNFLQFHKHEICVDAVKIFYSNLTTKEVNGHLTLSSRINGRKIVISREFLNVSFGVPIEAEQEFECNLSRPQLLEHFRFDYAYAANNRIRIGGLNPQRRYLVYVITRLLQPRKTHHSLIYKSDLITLWFLTHDFRVDWGTFIMKHMLFCRNKPGEVLPYPCHIYRFITEALENVPRVSIIHQSFLWQINASTFREARPPPENSSDDDDEEENDAKVLALPAPPSAAPTDHPSLLQELEGMLNSGFERQNEMICQGFMDMNARMDGLDARFTHFVNQYDPSQPSYPPPPPSE